MLQQTTLPDELPFGLDEPIESAHVALQFAQQSVVLDRRQCLAYLVGGASEHDQRALAVGTVNVIGAVVLQEFYEGRKANYYTEYYLFILEF